MDTVNITPLVPLGALAAFYVKDEVLPKLRRCVSNAIDNYKKCQVDKRLAQVAAMVDEMVDDKGMLKTHDNKAITDLDAILDPLMQKVAEQGWGVKSTIPADVEKIITARKTEAWRLKPNKAGYPTLAFVLAALESDPAAARDFDYAQKTHGAWSISPDYEDNRERKWDIYGVTEYFEKNGDVPEALKGWDSDPRLISAQSVDPRFDARTLSFQNILNNDANYCSFREHFQNESWIEYMLEQGWVDILPAVLRTPETVEQAAMNLYTAGDGYLPPDFDKWELVQTAHDSLLQQAITPALNQDLPEGFKHPWPGDNDDAAPKKPSGPKM